MKQVNGFFDMGSKHCKVYVFRDREKVYIPTSENLTNSCHCVIKSSTVLSLSFYYLLIIFNIIKREHCYVQCLDCNKYKLNLSRLFFNFDTFMFSTHCVATNLDNEPDFGNVYVFG